MIPAPRTVKVSSLVYGERLPALDDPAELYHEASKLSRGHGARGLRVGLLAQSRELRSSLPRAGKRYAGARELLPRPSLPDVSLGEAIHARRSDRTLAGGAPTPAELSALLHAAYGTTDRAEERGEPGRELRFRVVPSGGALYPLELYVAGAPAAGVRHYEPDDHALVAVGARDAEQRLRGALVGDGVPAAAAIVVVTALFWRSRFKYGLRGYRFVLLEAGHVCQNLLLAAAALGVPALPIGGYFDRAVDEALELDGVDESALYLIALGGSGG